MEASAPISLYLDLAEGESANIEVVAKAALAWSAAVKELAYVIDPSMEVEIELISGTEGSLDLNACLKAFAKFAEQKPKLATVIVTSLTWFMVQTGSYTYERVLDWLTGKDAPPVVRQLSQSEVEAIAREVVAAQEKQVAADQRRQLFHELNKDTSIVGVGVTQERDTRPAVIVPRAEFAERAGSTITVSEAEVKRRTEVAVLPVILVSPTLKDAERSWRFQAGNLPEFGAVMKDHAFLNALVAGRIALPLRAGVEMQIELETKQEKVGDVWVVRERSVLRVLQPTMLDDPSGLPFARQ